VTSSRLTNALVFAGIVISVRLLWNWAKRGSPFNMGDLGTPKTSRAAHRFIGRKIRILRHEGYPARQAQAVAYSMARKKGYKVGAR